MNLFYISMAALGGLFYLSIKGRRALKSESKDAASNSKSDAQTAVASAAAGADPVKDEPPVETDTLAGDKAAPTESSNLSEETTPSLKEDAGSEVSPQKTAEAEPETPLTQTAKAEPETPPAQTTEARSETSPQEKVDSAVSSNDVDTMVAILEEIEDPLLRDTLFTQIVGIYYRGRSESDNRRDFYEYAGRHLEEISTILTALEQSGKGRPDRVETFKMMAITMEEDECYDDAVEVSKKALSLGLKDGTRTGFGGRISRLEKKKKDSSR